MNALALEQRGDVLIVDCGVTFDNRGLGIDVIHSDFSAIKRLASGEARVAGLWITHGHEDHIGAIPYFLRQFDVPIFAPPYALELLRERSGEHEILKHARTTAIEPRKRYAVGSFIVEPVRVTHSIADATAAAIETDAGMIFHTGDFKFDDHPADGEHYDIDRMRELGDAGVSLLFSDSTNTDVPGPTGSESSVRGALHDIVASSKGAVIVGLFASNVHRLRILGEIAKATGRILVPLGRSVGMHARVAAATGYLPWGADRLFRAENLRDVPRERILAIATGTQAETRSALLRLSRGEHSSFAVKEGDTVIFSSRIIPGHEPEVYAMKGDFLRRGVNVRSRATDRGVHVSGHAHRVDQQRMIELIRPNTFVPVHGTLDHLTRHASLARELGVKETCILENGDIADFDGKSVRKLSHAPVGRVHAFAGREIPGEVLKDRMQLGAGGVVIVSVEKGDISVRSLGVMGIDDADGVAAMKSAVKTAVDEARDQGSTSKEAITDAARTAVRRVAMKRLGYKPLVVVVSAS